MFHVFTIHVSDTLPVQRPAPCRRHLVQPDFMDALLRARDGEFAEVLHEAEEEAERERHVGEHPPEMPPENSQNSEAA